MGGAGSGGGRGICYFIQLQCTHSKVKFKGNPQCSNVQSFMLVIKNNEAVLVIKWSAAPNNKMTCVQSEDSDQPGHPPSLARVFAVRLTKFRSLATHTAHNDSDQTADAQTVLSLCCTHMSFCLICRVQAKKKMSCIVNRPVWFWPARTSLKTYHVAP